MNPIIQQARAIATKWQQDGKTKAELLTEFGHILGTTHKRNRMQTDQLSHVATITAHRTSYDQLNANQHTNAKPVKLTPTEAVDYLNADPRMALVITSVTVGVRVHPLIPNGHHIAVFRGAAETSDNFFYQELPLSNPDADGGDLDAETAIAYALDALCS